MWLDDETLQKQEVYIPSLPPEYEPHRLAQVMQRQQVGLSLYVFTFMNEKHMVQWLLYNRSVKSHCAVLYHVAHTYGFVLTRFAVGTLAGVCGPGASAV